MPDNQIAAQRLYLTADKSALVGEGDKRTATLYAAIGDEIPAGAAEKFGLVGGKLPARKASSKKASGGAKSKSTPANKSKSTPADKEQAPPEDKGGAQ